MQEADASPPEPVQQQAVEETIAPTPPQEKPEVVAPPEQKLEPTPAKPEPAKIVPVEKPAPEKPKVVRPEAKKPSEAPPAPRTSAPPRAEREAPAASAMSAGAIASLVATYNQRVRAHLMRLHSYPSGGNGQRGLVRVSFTIGRNGQVTSSRHRFVRRCRVRCQGHVDDSPGLAIPADPGGDQERLDELYCSGGLYRAVALHCHALRKRGIQYAGAARSITGAAAYWIARSKPGDDRIERAPAYFAFRKSATSSSMNSSSSALLGSRLDENGRLLSLPTMMWVSSTRSTFSMVKNGKV